MTLRTFFPSLATHGTNRGDEERGLEIFPEDTLEEVPVGDSRIYVDNDLEVLNEEDADYIVEEPNDNNYAPRQRQFSSATAFNSFSKSFLSVETPTWLEHIKTFVFPPKENIESFIPNYRQIPIISGLLIPFSILLQIPGVTVRWYIRTENSQVVQSRANPILDVCLAFSLACALLANMCLITRFLEKRVKTMTIFCTVFLTIHDIINIVAVTLFGVEHHFNGSFTYGQFFWMTICSTIASSFTNATLLWDLYRTPDFNKSGSGLTRRQRSLVIIVMFLFCYTCFGALINSFFMKLTFIDGLYFTLVSIESIGFGDIVPKTTGARLFVCIYSTFGFLNLGVAIGMCRETLLEGMEVGYKQRAQNVKERLKEIWRRRRAETQWRRGIEWRLKEIGVPVWIRDENWHGQGTGGRRMNRIKRNRSSLFSSAVQWVGFNDRQIGHSYMRREPIGMRLNLNALTHAELEASALEAGVALEKVLPPDFIPAREGPAAHNDDADVASNSSAPPGWIRHPLAPHFETAFRPTQALTRTHAKIGGMTSLLTRFAVAAIHENAAVPDERHNGDVPFHQNVNPVAEAVLSGETSDNLQENPTPRTEIDKGVLPIDPTAADLSDKLGLQMMRDFDTKAFYSKLIIAWSLFILFWVIGSAIFSATEGWPYGDSMYFCFVTFTTIGYGDFAPKTPAGRSVFVVWAILGVGTMTMLISVVTEAYGSRFKYAVHSRAFEKAVTRYRKRVQRRLHLQGTSTRADQSELPQANTRLEPDFPPAPLFSQTTCPKLQKKSSSVHTRTQESLETLPGRVLQHAEAFRTYICLFINDGITLDTQKSVGAGAMASAGMADVGDTLRRLLDEIAMLGGIGKTTKDEILQDPDARHTLIVLSIEKALQKMIDAAQEAMEAIQERDQLAGSTPQSEPVPEENSGRPSKL